MNRFEALSELGLASPITRERLVKRYRELAKERHPDSGRGDTSPDAFVRLQEAYRTLSASVLVRSAVLTQARTMARAEAGKGRARRDASSAHRSAAKRDGRKTRRDADRTTPRRAAERTGDNVERPPSVQEVITLGHTALEAQRAAVRSFAVRRLGEIGAISGLAFLQQALYDSDHSVRIAAVTAVARFDNSAAASVILGAYGKLTTLQKCSLVRSLGQSGTAVRWRRVANALRRERDYRVRAEVSVAFGAPERK